MFGGLGGGADWGAAPPSNGGTDPWAQGTSTAPKTTPGLGSLGGLSPEEEPPFAGGAADDMMAAIAGEAALGALGDDDDDETFGGEFCLGKGYSLETLGLRAAFCPRMLRVKAGLPSAPCRLHTHAPFRSADPRVWLPQTDRLGRARALPPWRSNSSKSGAPTVLALGVCSRRVTLRRSGSRRKRRWLAGRSLLATAILPTRLDGGEHHNSTMHG